MACRPFKPSNAQVQLLRDMIEALNIKKLPEDLLSDKSVFDSFVNSNKSAFYKIKYPNTGNAKFEQENKERRAFILRNLPLQKVAEMLGFKFDRDKGGGDWKVYKLFDDVIMLNAKKDKDDPTLVFTTCAVPYGKEDAPKVELNIKGLTPLSSPREIKSYSGDVINFVASRAPNYSFKDIMNMLYDLAKDIKLAEKYGLDYTIVENKDYSIKESDANALAQKNESWASEYNKRLKEALPILPIDFKTRGLDLKEIMRLSTNAGGGKIFFKETKNTPYDNLHIRLGNSFFKKDRYGKIAAEMPSNQHLFSGFYTLSYPIHNIDYSVVDGKVNAKISAVGDQKMPIITDDFFDSIRAEKKVNFEQYNYGGTEKDIRPEITERATLFRDRVEKFVPKISKMEIPNDLRDDLSIGLMAKRLGYYKGLDTPEKIEKHEKYNLLKMTSFNSSRGLVFLNKKNTPADTLLIVENPVFDGTSAIKLGYIKEENTLIVGSFGNPSQKFFENLDLLIKLGGALKYKSILIGTDNDDAGEMFYHKCNNGILQIYGGLLNKYLKDLGQEPLNIEPNDEGRLSFCLEDLNRFSKRAISIAEEQGNENAKRYLSSFADIEITRLLPKSGAKDFNEELINSLKKNEEIGNGTTQDITNVEKIK